MPDDAPKPDRRPRPPRLPESRVLDLFAARLDELTPAAALSVLAILTARYEAAQRTTRV